MEAAQFYISISHLLRMYRTEKTLISGMMKEMIEMQERRTELKREKKRYIYNPK